MTDRPPEPGFTPISPNPYIVGNPVRDRSMFFGREAEFEFARKRFHDSKHGMLLVFCGERRSGKTSILFQILDRRLGPGYIPVLIDMQSMAVESEIEFLARICEDVLAALDRGAKGLSPPSFTPDSNHAATFQKFIRDVLRAHPGKNLVLLFDEYELFENKIVSGQLAHDVLLILANLIENERVFLIFTGSQHLDQRRREYWEKFLPKSQSKMISFLDRKDALNLIRRPVEGRVRYAEGTVEAIHRLTAGQPFYTQAICQSLVDQLNERHANHATPEIVAEVVDGIVNNPLPQMIFLWDALERDEKLVLALLAESLAGQSDHSGVADVARLLRKRQYPLALDQARIATTLEKLFRSEMLARDDRTTPPGYAFRMDLWRLWIRRQHSVWQVMRELGIEIRRRVPVVLWATGGLAAVIIGVAVAGLALWGNRRPPNGPPAAPTGPAAFFALDVQPEEAIIHLDDRRMGMGAFRDAIAADSEHVFRLTAAGYADSLFPVRVAAGDSGSRRVQLRALLGGLRVETQPPGALVKVDGRPPGHSPLTVSGLAVARVHRVEATLDGYSAAQREVRVRPDTMITVAVALEVGRADVSVTSLPTGSQIRLDGRDRELSPTRLDLTFGTHTLSAAHDGYLDREITLVVTANTRQVHLVLEPEPSAILVVKGDALASQILVDGNPETGGVYTTGALRFPKGPHTVQVILRSGERVDTTVTIHPGMRTTFDYSNRTVTRSRPGAP